MFYVFKTISIGALNILFIIMAILPEISVRKYLRRYPLENSPVGNFKGADLYLLYVVLEAKGALQ